MSDSEQEYMTCFPPDITEGTKGDTSGLAPRPKKSQSVYQAAYQKFIKWCEDNNETNYPESALMRYFFELANKMKCQTMWSQYSMIKLLLNNEHGVDIGKYSNLKAYLKKQNEGCIPKKSRVFTREEFYKFLSKASDKNYLEMKVVLIFGISGRCRCEELVRMKIDDIEDLGSSLNIKVPKSSSNHPRQFKVVGEKFINIYRKYAALRPEGMNNKRFFLKYKNGKCYRLLMGVHKIGNVCREVASYLNLPNWKEYTGHGLRRTSEALLGTDDITSLYEGFSDRKETTCKLLSNSVSEIYPSDAKLNHTESTIVNNVKKANVNENLNNQFNLCRICMLPGGTVDIHNTKIEEDFLIDILLRMASINKEMSLQFNLVCNKCCIKITSFHAFRERILESEKVLKETYLKEIKTEQLNISEHMNENNCFQDSDEVFVKLSFNNIKKEEIQIEEQKIITNKDSDEVSLEPNINNLKSEKLEIEDTFLFEDSGNFEYMDVDNDINEEFRSDNIELQTNEIHHSKVRYSVNDFKIYKTHKIEDFLLEEDSHTCDLCAEVYNAIQMNEHLKEKHNITRFACKDCKISFVNFSSLNIHLRSEHAVGKNCNLDESSSPHLKTDQTETQICNISPKEFPHEHTLESHTGLKQFGGKSDDTLINTSINTNKSQASVWKQFTSFCKQNSYKLTERTTCEEISLILSSWASNIKNRNGGDYKGLVIKHMWSMTAKLIQEMFYKKWKITISPFSDDAFQSARDVKDAKLKYLQNSTQNKNSVLCSSIDQ